MNNCYKTKKHYRVKHSWTHAFSHETWYTGSIRSQPPCVRLLTFHNLSLFTVSFLVSIYSLASQTPKFLKTWREGSGELRMHTVKLCPNLRFLSGSILGSLVAISLLFSLPFCILWLYLPLYSHLRLTDSHSRSRKTANWPTNLLHVCLLGASKYFRKIWTGGPITMGVQILCDRP